MRQDYRNIGKYCFSYKHTYFVTYRLVCKSQNELFKGGIKAPS